MNKQVKLLFSRHEISTRVSWDRFMEMVEADGYKNAKLLYVKFCNEVVASWNNHI